MAEESCDRHLGEEAILAEGDVTASFDGAWQKRGAGRGYNSLTGLFVFIFKVYTCKMNCYSVKGKRCRCCTAAKKKGVPPRNHKCSLNWTGSAKSMEPAMACEMLHGVIDKGQRVKILVMDNDSTTIARVKATEDATQLATDLDRIVPHLYGEHGQYGTWCKNKTSYKPKNLPYGKPLSNKQLRCDLEILLRKYAAKANELESLGSTQSNERFIHMVSTKAPKRLKPPSKLNKKCRISTVKYTIKFTSKLMQSLNKRRMKQSQRESKRRRLELKHERSSKDATQTVLEGDSYDSKIGLELDEESVDLEDLTISQPQLKKERPLIFFDLETTGLARTSDIIQIAAVCGKEQLNRYMAPTRTISLEASQATGLTYIGGTLKHNGHVVQTTTQKAGLENFLKFLNKFTDPILIGHNIQNFDIPILINQLKKSSLETERERQTLKQEQEHTCKELDAKRNELEKRKNLSELRIVDDITRDNVLLINSLKENPERDNSWYFNGKVFAEKGDVRHPVDLFERVENVFK
ncbi:LOW QUALITY PROTEIN: uncharacterized protein LOC117341782 [Pecten maximus]|uniref:LOW QUALITY PROTEIN: uncharacterized protein LOC117341782 n=1 Tax=Pecten maximus TaxID=6579 RepID=UPI001457F9F4|nr:LOW QUALITY PROTEIN: uncharacterized protein LOC117341782 [Pecten maximus]